MKRASFNDRPKVDKHTDLDPTARQSAFALLVGATRQSVNQELRRWEKAGWIRIGYGGVEVIDREALKRETAGNRGEGDRMIDRR